MTTIIILSIIPILIICASLYFTNRRIDKMTNTMKSMYSSVQFHDVLINFVIADDLREIKELLVREQLEDYKLELHTNANDPKSQA